MLTELNEVLDRLKQGPSQIPQSVETSHTSGDETDSSKRCRKILSSRIASTAYGGFEDPMH